MKGRWFFRMDDPSIPSNLIFTTSATLIPLTIVLVILIVLSSFFSATETAFTSASNVRLKKLAQKKRTARRVLKYTEKYDQVLSCILIGNNIVNILATTISTIICTEIWGASLGPIITTIGLTIIVLIFGEITPKMLAREFAESFLCKVIYFFEFFYYIFYPFNIMFDGWKWLIAKIFKIGKKGPTLTEDEFKMIVSDIKEEGVLNQNEHDLIQKSIVFDDTLVQDIMTKKEDIISVNKRMSDIEIKNLFEANNYSRVPYMSEDGEILGVLYQKDFYEMLLEKNCEIEDIVNPILFVRPNLKIANLFKLFQSKKQHMAMVYDNHIKEVVGLVTLEDVLEELVGEIDDEYDAEDEEKEIISSLDRD